MTEVVRLHVLHVITGLGNGGAEAVLSRLCVSERQYRHSVVSLTDEGRYGATLKSAGVEVQSLGMRPGSVTPADVIRLWGVLRRLSPDLVQTWMYHADLLGGTVARLAVRAPVCWNIRHSSFEHAKLGWSMRVVLGLSARLSAVVPRRIVCCADSALRAHAQLGFASRLMTVIPNGCDTERFQPDRASGMRLRDQLDLPSGETVVGFVARYNPDKDHSTLLRALALVRENGARFRCLLVGERMSSENAQLVQLVERLGLQEVVCLLGPRPDVPAVMNALDLHVMSSSSEAFPNVLAEAMACGTPCVATDVGDARQIVGDVGWLVPARDPVALATALATAMASFGDRGGWERRQAAARSRIASLFSMSAMLDGYRRVWAEVLGSG